MAANCDSHDRMNCAYSAASSLVSGGGNAVAARPGFFAIVALYTLVTASAVCAPMKPSTLSAENPTVDANRLSSVWSALNSSWTSPAPYAIVSLTFQS